MGKIVSGMCSSHSPALMVPFEDWQHIHDYIESHRKEPHAPEVQAGLDLETEQETAQKHAACLAALSTLRNKLREARPDLVVIFGDDQNENFTESNMPPFAVYTGEGPFGYPLRLRKVYFDEGVGNRVEVRGLPAVAKALVAGAAEAGFDLAHSSELPDKEWGLPHSIIRLVHHLDITAPVLPIFVNALYEPAAPPKRCYQLGVALRGVLERVTPDDFRTAVIGSGGMSHTPRGPRAGFVDADSDRWVVDHIRAGTASNVAEMTTADLWRTSQAELRELLPALGLIGDRPPDYLEHLISFHMIAGYGFASWTLN